MIGNSISKDEIARFLTRTHGLVIGGRALTRTLAYPTQEAFRQAESRGTLPVKVFSIPHRRGKFAYTSEVAAWLVNLAREEKKGELE